MWQKSMGNRRKIPFCADPENHVLVETREGLFWRKKRAKGKLNESFSVNANLSRISGPAAKQVVQRLRPFLKGLETGRLTLRVSNALRSSLKEKKTIDFASVNGLEFQRDYPLDCLLIVPFKVEIVGQRVNIKIEIGLDSVEQKNSLATHFYFEAVLLHGDPNLEDSIRVESIESKLFAFGVEYNETCELVLDLPEEGVQWMLALKVSCLEGNEMAAHPKHYGMKVVKTAAGSQVI